MSIEMAIIYGWKLPVLEKDKKIVDTIIGLGSIKGFDFVNGVGDTVLFGYIIDKSYDNAEAREVDLQVYQFYIDKLKELPNKIRVFLEKYGEPKLYYWGYYN